MNAFTIDQLTLSATDKATLREFVASWDQHRYPVLYVGAGLSKFCARRRSDIGGDSKFSSWTELLDDLKRRLANGDDAIMNRLATDPLRLAQIFEEQFGRAALLDVVARHVPSADFVPGEEHQLLRGIPWAAIVTTNYDDLLERAFEPTRRVRKVVTDEDLTQHRTLEDLLVVKMHGDLTMRDTIVLSEEDYRRYPARRPGLSIKVRQLLIEHPLLFIGFSLTDPHFSTIDGWIRDTVGRVRLPAIAIVHGESVPAERTMWKARGIELVRLPADDSLARLLTALAAERRLPVYRNAGNFNERVGELEQRAFALAREDDPKRVNRLAECLRDIVAGAKSDLDRGTAAGGAVRFFCSGWHAILSNDVISRASQVSVPRAQVTAKEVYEFLSESERRQLLMLALETGTSTLRLDGAIVDIADELIQNPIYRLMNDERASVYLHSARIQRNIDATVQARKSIAAARALDPSTHIKTLLSAEMREVLFQEGDAREIEAELRRPLDEGSDVLAMCRRGADSLLLRQRDDASQWYKAALERATTGDEKYAALWGQLACAHETLTFGVEARSRETEIWRRLRAIPEEERPVSRRVQELIEDAGDTLLDGKQVTSAIEKLLQFLEEARRLGWPHSPDHNVSYLIESAARRAARLLLGDDNVSRIGSGARAPP